MAAPKRSSNFWFNLDLVLTEIGRWPIATLSAQTLLTALIVFLPESGFKFGPFGNALMIAGYQLALLGGKGMLLLVAYRRLHKAEFPGSYLMSTGMVFVPIFTFFAISLPLLAKERGEEVSVAMVLAFVLLAYPIFVLFFAGTMRAQHAMQPLQDKLSSLLWKRPPR